MKPDTLDTPVHISLSRLVAIIISLMVPIFLMGMNWHRIDSHEELPAHREASKNIAEMKTAVQVLGEILKRMDERDERFDSRLKRIERAADHYAREHGVQ